MYRIKCLLRKKEMPFNVSWCENDKLINILSNRTKNTSLSKRIKLNCVAIEACHFIGVLICSDVMLHNFGFKTPSDWLNGSQRL